MKQFNITDFKKGSLIGDFQPTLWKTFYFEAGLKEYKAGDEEPAHYHKMAWEWTIVSTGTISMNGQIFEEGSVIQIDPTEVVEFKAITDAKTFVIKIPSLPNDKFLV